MLGINRCLVFQVNLTKILYIGTLFKCRFIQNSVFILVLISLYMHLFIMFFFQFTSQSFDDVGSSYQLSISSISSLRDRSFSLKSITPSINSAFSGLASSNSTPVYSNIVSICRLLNLFHSYRVRHGCDRMVVGFTNTYAISA